MAEVYSASVVARLARYTTVDPSGCHLWIGFRDNNGYGRIFADKRNRQAYRVAFEISIGRRLMPAECVCHKCDVPACLNLDHLFLGSHHDNIRDAVAKGRVKPPRATGRWGWKLSPDQTRAIARDGRAQRVIAADYGISQARVCSIRASDRAGGDRTRQQLGGNLARNVSKPNEGVSLSHGPNHGASDVREVVKAYRSSVNVSRSFGN